MNVRNLAITILILAAPGAGAFAQDLHLPDGNRVEFEWVVTDGKGYKWDLQSNCCVGNGTRTGVEGIVTYDGCMLPHVNSVRFDAREGGGLVGSPPARYREDPREIEGGPWTVGPLRISKRVHVPTDAAYCRWIDIYENTSDRDFAFALRYRIDVSQGIQQVLTPSGEKDIGEDHCAFLTADGEGSGRPVLCHVFANKGAPLRAKVQIGRDGPHIIEYDWEVKIPAGNRTG